MNDIGVRLGGDNSDFKGMIDDSQAAVGKFGRSISDLIPALTGAAVVGFFKTVLDHAGALQDLSDRLGVSTDALQAFDYTARLAGATSEQANLTWDKSRKALDGLAAGTPEVVKQFDRLGLSAKDFIGLNYEEALEKIAKGYADNQEKAGAYEAITSILGEKSSPKLLAALLELADKGMGGLKKATEEAGQMIDSAAIKKMDDFGDRITTVKGSLIAWGGSVASVFLGIGEKIGQVASVFANIAEGRADDWDELTASADKFSDTIKKLPPALIDISKEEAEIKKVIGEQDAALESQLELIDQLNNNLDKQNAYRVLIASGEYDARQTAEGKLALEKLILEQIKIGAALSKEANKEEKEAIEEHIKEMDQEQKEAEAAAKNAKELATLLLKGAQSLTGEERIRLDILLGVTTQQKINAETVELTAKLVAGTLTPAEKERLGVLTNQTEQVNKQVNAMAELLLKVQQFQKTGTSLENQSTDALTGLVNRLKSEYDALRLANDMMPAFNNNSTGVAIAGSNLTNAQKVLQERQAVQAYAERYGPSAARAQFGDTATNQALQDMQTSSAKTAIGVANISNQLAGAGLGVTHVAAHWAVDAKGVNYLVLAT